MLTYSQLKANLLESNNRSQSLWAGMHPRANRSQQSSLPSYQRTYRPRPRNGAPLLHPTAPKISTVRFWFLVIIAATPLTLPESWGRIQMVRNTGVATGMKLPGRWRSSFLFCSLVLVYYPLRTHTNGAQWWGCPAIADGLLAVEDALRTWVTVLVFGFWWVRAPHRWPMQNLLVLECYLKTSIARFSNHPTLEMRCYSRIPMFSYTPFSLV